MANQGNQPTAINTVTQPAVIQARMNTIPKKCDPIPRTDKDLSSSLNINNNGGALYSFGTHSIVDTYATNEEKQRRENEEQGYGAITNAEANILQCSFFDDCYEDDWYPEDDYDYYAQARYEQERFEQDRIDFLEANYDDTWKYDKETYARYGTNSDLYIEQVESGEIIDDGMSCKMNPAKMGASLSEEEMEAAKVGNEASNEASNESDAQAPTAETTAEGPTEPPSPIETDVNLSGAFAEATVPRAAPTNVAPRPTEPANSPAYQMSA